MNTPVMMHPIAEAGVSCLLTHLKQISKQQGFNSMFRRTHGTPYWS
jgi:hypothetical protein